MPMARSGVVDLHAVRRALTGNSRPCDCPRRSNRRANPRIEPANDDESRAAPETGNRGVTDGSPPDVTRKTLEATSAAHSITVNGRRTMLDVKVPTEMPCIGERRS
jgi:hypothetical protein